VLNRTTQALVPTLNPYVTDYLHVTPEVAEAHTKRWIEQFDQEDRDVILEETRFILDRNYLPISEFKRNIAMLFGKGVWGDAGGTAIQQARFITQHSGKGQSAIFQLVDQYMTREYGLTIEQCGLEQPEQFLFIDDCAFTGNTALADVVKAIGSSPTMRYLHLWFMAGYTSGINYLQNQLQVICQARGIDLKIWCGRTYCDSVTDPTLDVMRPCRTLCQQNIGVPFVARQMRGVAVPNSVFRADAFPPVETLFSNSTARRILEQAFLLQGIDLVSACSAPRPDMKPLGFVQGQSFGFGAMVFTYRNTPNNCPLVMWWGDPEKYGPNHPLGQWYPLLPRNVRGA